MDPEIKYMIGNLLNEQDISSISIRNTPQSISSSAKLSERERILKNYLQNMRESQIKERFYKFSLIEGKKYPSHQFSSRHQTFESILNEEQFRMSNGGLDETGHKLYQSAAARAEEHTKAGNKRLPAQYLGDKQLAAFQRVKKRLEALEQFCPSLYYIDTDIITVWGNLTQGNP